MYKAIEKIEALREDKIRILKDVYQSKNLDGMYNRQRELGFMAVSIYTDVANVVMPVLKEDGLNNVLWSNISLKLEKISFINMPSATEIRDKYNKCVDKPTVIDIEGANPKPGEKTEVKKIPIPAFLAAIASQGIAVPIILNVVGGMKFALVKIFIGVNVACMVIEVVQYFDLWPKQNKRKRITSTKENLEIDYQTMYDQAIQEICNDNLKRLNAWFDKLVEITTDEIKKASGKAGE